MSGYREQDFDPNAGGNYGAPLRPYNGTQWAGVALICIGLAFDLVYFAGRLGWILKPLDSPLIAMGPLLLGAALVNSRREPTTPEQRARIRRRSLIAVAVALVACAVGFATAFYFKGAH